MKKGRSSTIMLVAPLVFLLLKIVVGRNLSEVTYHITTCGQQGRTGPTFSKCNDHYQSPDTVGLSVINHLSEVDGFAGGQQFTFPRSGRYRIRIAGASGGRGLCNPRGGYGAVFSLEVDIVENDNDTYLIVVGQRGISPCDTNPSFPLCSNPPSNLSEADQCFLEWDTNYSYDHTGGGGGGGGSMLWPKNNDVNNYISDVVPLVAAAGGGGTHVRLNYTSIRDSRLPMGGLEETYDAWINAQLVSIDGLISAANEGTVGNGAANDISEIYGGFGAGWSYPESPLFVRTEKDGYILSQSENFSLAGDFCSSSSSMPFSDVTGGFGGGGGACSQGGGGGGYGGGWAAALVGGVFDFDVSGRGGYSLPNNTDTSLPYNEGDGYVMITPLDCGCASGQCNITEDDQFNCICNEGSTLFTDEVSCVMARSPNITVTSNLIRNFNNNSFEISLEQFERLYNVLSVAIQFSVQSQGPVKRAVTTMDEDVTCVGIFVDSNGLPVLILEANETNNYTTTGLYDTEFNMLTLQDGGQEVAGILLFNNADQDQCAIDTLTLTFDADIEPKGSFSAMLEDIVSTHSTIFQSVVTRFLTQTQPPAAASITTPPSNPSSTITPSIPTTATTSLTSSSIDQSTNVFPSMTDPNPSTGGLSTTIIAIVVVVSVLGIVLILVIILACLLICRRQCNSKKVIYQVRSSNGIPNGLSNGGTITRRGTLQRLKTRFMSLTSNPNYGETTIQGDEFIDLSVKPKETTDEVDTSTSNLYDSVNLSSGNSNSLKRTTRMGSRKSSMSGAFRMRSKSKRRTYTLKPKYGVMAPSVNFYEYNLNRSEDDSWEYDRTQLTYMREIGEGQFGKVLLMKAKNIAGFNGKLPVAVKTLSSIDEEDNRKFLEEVELMKKFCHSNIVSLLGVNSQESEGAPLMILEYMPYGDLQNFLKRHKPKGAEASFIGSYHHKKFARDVVLALQFLSENKYVHRDVAARNCLVGPSLEVKLADFGMARGVHEKDYYKIAGKAVLPVRWMAPESLLYGIFNSSSDVWSFGVLLWEIVTYGDMPLETLNPQAIVDMAQMQTLIHPFPLDTVVSEELMEIKEKCHIWDPETRVTFAEIIELLPPSTNDTLPRNN